MVFLGCGEKFCLGTVACSRVSVSCSSIWRRKKQGVLVFEGGSWQAPGNIFPGETGRLGEEGFCLQSSSKIFGYRNVIRFCAKVERCEISQRGKLLASRSTPPDSSNTLHSKFINMKMTRLQISPHKTHLRKQT